MLHHGQTWLQKQAGCFDCLVVGVPSQEHPAGVPVPSLRELASHVNQRLGAAVNQPPSGAAMRAGVDRLIAGLKRPGAEWVSPFNGRERAGPVRTRDLEVTRIVSPHDHGSILRGLSSTTTHPDSPDYATKVEPQVVTSEV